MDPLFLPDYLVLVFCIRFHLIKKWNHSKLPYQTSIKVCKIEFGFEGLWNENDATYLYVGKVLESIILHKILHILICVSVNVFA